MQTQINKQETAPGASAGENGIPDLYVRVKQMLLPVTPAQAVWFMEAVLRDAAWKTGNTSGVKDIPLFDADGQRIGHVSPDRRCFLDDAGGCREIPPAGGGKAVVE